MLLFLFASCRSSKLLETPSLPVTFEGDSLFFDGLDREWIGYSALSNVVRLSVELRPNQKLSVPISRPTSFARYATSYTVYPGENITITIDENGNPFFVSKGNEERSREMRFEAAFQQLNYRLIPKFPPRTKEYSIDSILLFEQQIIGEVPAYINRSKALLDSLATAYTISENLKSITRIKLENEHRSMLYGFYFDYQQELKAHSLYVQKLRTLLSSFNSIKEKQQIYYGGSLLIERVMPELMPVKDRVREDRQLRDVMDTVNKNLKALSRDFYLTQVMYHALYRRVPVSKRSLRTYYRSCKDVSYESIVRNLVAQQKMYAAQSKQKKDNRLIAFADSKVYTLGEVLAQHKGKLVLVDIWASWCVPCQEQQPYMEKLHKRLAEENISFLYLSMDRDLLKWRLRSGELNLDPSLSFVFENFEKQSFLKNYKIETIPRYLLLDENGNMINADAPTPDTGELEKLIQKHLIKE